jgi:hypothetical protein
MTQARGRKGRLAYVEENTWGTTPSSPSMTQLKAATYGESLGGNIAKIVSNVINARGAQENARGGNIDVSGSLPFELPLVGMGTLFKHALGGATTGQDATQTTAITGVEILYAEKGATSGDGSLAYTNSTTKLAWTAPGDTAGTGVDVSGGGDFTLESSTDGEALTVRVTAANLPGQDESDTITVQSEYKHRITRGTLPTGLTVEKGFTDIAQYIRFKGIKVNQLSVEVGNSGLASGSLDVMGKEFATATSELGSPSVPTHNPFIHHEATVEEGGATATVQALSMQVMNNLDGDNYPVGSAKRYALPEGDGDLTGSATFFFEDATYLDKWKNETESSLKAAFSNSNGSVTFKMPKIKYFEAGVPMLESAQGIVLPLNYQALASDDPDNTDLVVEIVNDQATI